MLVEVFSTLITNDGKPTVGGAIRLAGAKLTSFHAGEHNRTAPGRGYPDWDEIFGALAGSNYKGKIASTAG